MNSHNCINNPKAIAAALRAHFKERGMTQEEISEAFHINQGQVSRILNGHFKECKGNVAKLCKYAKLNVVPIAVDPTQSSALMRALGKIWDGSEKHANAIAKVLLALGNMKYPHH